MITKPITEEDRNHLFQWLNKNNLMAIATFSKEPWIATVYYIVDDDLNLYFISNPARQHSKDIVKNNKVACAIADSHQKAKNDKTGIQLQGVATQVRSLDKVKWMLKMWHKINPGLEKELSFKNFKDKIIDSRVYRVAPKKIKLFDEREYKGEEETIFVM